MADYISSHSGAEIDSAVSAVADKVDKVTGKGLSTNDFTDTLKTLLELKKVKDVTTDALNDRLVITYTDDTSSNLNLNDVVTDIYVSGASLDATTNVLTLTSTSGGADVTVNLSDFVNSSELTSALAPINTLIEELDTKKQAVLLSGTNIKTINGISILGSGNLEVTGTGGGQSIGGETLIDDETESVDSTWSSNNINNNIKKAVLLHEILYHE